MRAVLRSFKCNTKGSASVLFGFMMIPVIGALGAAVDYGLALRVRTIQQTISDQTALVVADAETVAAATAGFNIARSELSKRLGDKFVLDRTSINGAWLDGSRYR
jgi:Flp pilus assembly protein TadG